MMPARVDRPPLDGISPLLMLATGASYAAMLPYWVRWFAIGYPAVDLRIGLTRSAMQFVTPRSLALLCKHPVAEDEWSDGSGPYADHLELAGWPDAMVVYPAS